MTSTLGDAPLAFEADGYAAETRVVWSVVKSQAISFRTIEETSKFESMQHSINEIHGN